MTLQEIVTQAPLTELPTDPALCPDCGNGDRLTVGGTETTLIGWLGGWDPNHTWTAISCGCGASFVRETKSANVWYTRNRYYPVVLRGLPSCFERYIYACRKCSGVVARNYTELDGTPLRKSMLLTTKDGPQYRAEYRCGDCGHGGVVDSDYYRPPSPPEKQPSASDKRNG